MRYSRHKLKLLRNYFSVVLWLTQFSLAAEEAKDCDPILARAVTLTGSWTNNQKASLPIRESWNSNRFTDPRQHDQNSFRYIVKTTGKNLVLSGLEPSYSSVKIFSQMLQSPELFSTSVISEAIQGTYGGGWGVILKVKPSSIISTMLADTDAIPGPMSMATPPQELFEYHGLYSLDAFLAESVRLRKDEAHRKHWKTWSYNEMKFLGGPDVQVIGLFVDLKTYAYPRDLKALVESSRQAAKDTNLPLILLP